MLAGAVDPDNVRKQLSRWTQAGWLCPLRRGLYALAPPFQKVKPHPFLVANRLVPNSYVSCQSALAYYSLIPEYVPVATSVTTARPARRDTPLGGFAFRHVKVELLRGYRLENLGGDQQAFVATTEKALLDLIHLQPGGDAAAHLREPRLHNLDRLDQNELLRQADRAANPKLHRAAARVRAIAGAEEYTTL